MRYAAPLPTPPAHLPVLIIRSFIFKNQRYGLVSKRNAAAIMDKCVLGTEGMKANWRGNMSNPGVKAEPAPKSAQAASPAPKAAPKPQAAMGRKEIVRRDSVEGA